MPVAGTRRRFSADEYQRMGKAGILHEDDRVELIDGEIVLMSSIGLRHASCVAKLSNFFSALRDQVLLWPQNPVRADHWSEPQPDVCLLRCDEFYEKAPVRPEDVLLAVEVADTSQRYDRSVKGPLYARTGIREYWLVDLVAEVVEVHREPTRDGYGSTEKLTRGDTLSPAAFPDFELSVADVLHRG